MTLCSSGSLSICTSAGTNRSIAVEVLGGITPIDPQSLTTLSETAGKTAPHSMLEFYGYSHVTYSISVNPDRLDFTNSYKFQFVCVDTTPNQGDFNIESQPTWLSVTKDTDFISGCCGVRISPTDCTHLFRCGDVILTHACCTNITTSITVTQADVT